MGDPSQQYPSQAPTHTGMQGFGPTTAQNPPPTQYSMQQYSSNSMEEEKFNPMGQPRQNQNLVGMNKEYNQPFTQSLQSNQPQNYGGQGYQPAITQNFPQTAPKPQAPNQFSQPAPSQFNNPPTQLNVAGLNQQPPQNPNYNQYQNPNKMMKTEEESYHSNQGYSHQSQAHQIDTQNQLSNRQSPQLHEQQYSHIYHQTASSNELGQPTIPLNQIAQNLNTQPNIPNLQSSLNSAQPQQQFPPQSHSAPAQQQNYGQTQLPPQNTPT